MDPLIAWAEEAHWSMGGLNFKHHRLQGRIEGNIQRLRTQRDQTFNKSPKHQNSVKASPSPRSENDSKSSRVSEIALAMALGEMNLLLWESASCSQIKASKFVRDFVSDDNFADCVELQPERVLFSPGVATQAFGNSYTRFSLENEVEVLAILGETSIINNFLFWHHRRWVSEKIGCDAAANNELEFTAKILSDFPYNHYAWWSHRWSHRQHGHRKVKFGPSNDGIDKKSNSDVC
ncbi:hypothetical protein CASFOL_041172 [Castilleja foliolosa]|uniref:Uncharacterized protein n=1 Tax=Castilleja foliolosa TaxID=1961234 RepID=A0ABD3BEM3_9LAMI